MTETNRNEKIAVSVFSNIMQPWHGLKLDPQKGHTSTKYAFLKYLQKYGAVLLFNSFSTIMLSYKTTWLS